MILMRLFMSKCSTNTKLSWYPQQHWRKISPQRICVHKFLHSKKRKSKAPFHKVFLLAKITFPKSANLSNPSTNLYRNMAQEPREHHRQNLPVFPLWKRLTPRKLLLAEAETP